MIDNSNLPKKVAVREWAIGRLGGPGAARVLELYGGAGVIYRACYGDVARHVSIDIKPGPGHARYVGDNRVLLPGLLCKADWNLFDLDAYASPWLLAAAVCRLRAPGEFALVLTCGIGRSLKTGKANPFVREKIGYLGLPPCSGLVRWYDDIVRWLIADWSRYGVVIRAVVRTACYPDMHYWAMLLKKDASTACTRGCGVIQSSQKED